MDYYANILATKFAVFYQEEVLAGVGNTSWLERHFGFEMIEDATAMFHLLKKATNHESRNPRGFRNVRLARKNGGVWEEIGR